MKWIRTGIFYRPLNSKWINQKVGICPDFFWKALEKMGEYRANINMKGIPKMIGTEYRSEKRVKL